MVLMAKDGTTLFIVFCLTHKRGPIDSMVALSNNMDNTAFSKPQGVRLKKDLPSPIP